MFLHFFESACQKRIRQSKIGCQFSPFHVETVLVGSTSKTVVQWTDQMSHRDSCASPGNRKPRHINEHEKWQVELQSQCVPCIFAEGKNYEAL